jgi:ADP-heptose:LPS heptosyltransferase
MKTIAVICLSPVGDVLNTSPVCVELKKNYPDSRLIYVTIPRSKEIAEFIPGVDKVLVYDKRGQYKGLGIFKWALSLWLNKQTEKIDIAVILNETFRGALVASLLGAKQRIGRISDGRKFLLTHTLPHTQEEKDWKIHVTKHYLRVLTQLGIYSDNTTLEIRYSEKNLKKIEDLLQQSNAHNKKLIGLCPCTALADKDLNQDEVAKFINYVNQNTDYKVAIVGIQDAKDFADKIRALGVTDFLDFTCKTNIPELLALVSKFKFMISADSAPMHMGFALNIPTIGLFMSTNFYKWGPQNYNMHRVIHIRPIVNGEAIIDEFVSLEKAITAKSLIN